MTNNSGNGAQTHNQPVTQQQQQIAIAVSRDANRRLLTDLLTTHTFTTIEEHVPAETDLCIIDERTLHEIGDQLTEWKTAQAPVFAPILLLAHEQTDPWARYATALSGQLDAIQPIPASKAAIHTRIASLLQTRAISKELNSERQFTEQIFNTSPIAKTVLDTEGNIIRANARAVDLFGLTESELTNRSYDAPEWQIVDETGDQIPSHELPFSRVLETGESVYGYEHGIVRPDEEHRWLSINMAPIRDEQDTIEYLVAAIDDITERKQLERDLRESEALQRATLSNIRDSVFITDETGSFTYVCPNTRYIFGYSPEEVRALGSVSELLGTDFIEKHPVTENGALENIEHQITDAHGDTHIVLVNVTPVSIQDGTRLYTVRDITDRKRQEERFKAFIENSSDIVTVIDDDGIIEYESPAVTRILGYEQDELVGKNAFSLIHPDDREEAKTILEEGITEAAGATLRNQYRFPHADGTWRWLESTATTRALSSGAHVVNSRDITDRIEAEQERRRLEETRTLALSAANAGIWEIDPGTWRVQMHESCERLLGIEPGTFTGELAAFLEYVHPDDRQMVTQTVRQFTHGTESTSLTYRSLTTDGVVLWVHSRAALISNPTDSHQRIVGVNVDITEQQERTKHLRVLDDVLRHNLHNQMNIIRGYAETIQEAATGNIASYATEIVETSDRILSTTDKQREITKVLSSEPQTEQLDLVPVIERIADTTSDRYPDVQFDLDLPHTAAALVTTQLSRAITELIENAIRHNDKPRKRVQLQVTKEDRSVMITITDNGPGIPEMEQEVVLGERQLEPLYHGSGLGLWLVAWIIRRSAGTLTFDSTESGTKVTIKVPAANTYVDA